MRSLRAIMMCLPLLSFGCTSSDDPKTTEEPLAPTEEVSAVSTDEAAPDAVGQEQPAAEATASSAESETVGELTAPDESSPEASVPPPESGFSDAPAGDESGYQDESASGKAVVRYVNAAKLNVRSGPSRSASVVRQLKRGDKVNAEFQGKFAKIGKGEWVRTKLLTAKAPGKGAKGKKAKAPRGKHKSAKKKKASPAE